MRNTLILTILVTIINITFSVQGHAGLFFQDEGSGEGRYALTMHHRGVMVWVGVFVNHEKKEVLEIDSPYGFFMESGATDYKNGLIFLVSGFEENNDYRLSYVNTNDRKAFILEEYTRKIPKFIKIAADGKRLVVTYWDGEHMGVDLYKIDSGEGGSVKLERIADHVGIEGFEQLTNIRGKYDETNNIMYFSRYQDESTEVVELDLIKDGAKTIGSIPKKKGEVVYLLSVKGDSILYVRHFENKEREFVVINKGFNKRKFFIKWPQYRENYDTAIDLSEDGSYVVIMRADHIKKQYNIVSYNLETGKEKEIPISKEVREYLGDKNKSIFNKDENGNIRLGWEGSYKINAEEAKIEKVIPPGLTNKPATPTTPPGQEKKQ